MWLWTLRDIAIIGIGALLSVFIIAQTGSFALLVVTAAFAFLTIRLDAHSILDFIIYAVKFFMIEPQYYEWRQESE